ncbi:haloalkane dehalogenase [Pavlovales sp. CCMP2436]|nr:haloalkane dehalogenase [Pavlovales sp. CCMP2436]
MHYVEEGQGEPILFLHGNPTSVYLWRNIIPHGAKVGRSIAVDLIGMGKSDKPDIAFSFDEHYAYLKAFIEALQLKKITLVIHDWGSALGFRYAHEHEANVRGIAFMEGMIRTLSFKELLIKLRFLFTMMRSPLFNWLLVAKGNASLKIFLPGEIVRELTKEEIAAYNAPYPTTKSRKVLMRWPQEIPFDGYPASTHATVTSYAQWLAQTQMPILFLKFSPGMLIDAKQAEKIESTLKNLTTVDLGEGRHFVQEDHPHEIGEAIVAWIRDKKLLA